MVFKLVNRNVHHRQDRMTPAMLLPWQCSWIQSLSVKNKYPHFQLINKTGTEGVAQVHTWFTQCIFLTLPIRLSGVHDP